MRQIIEVKNDRIGLSWQEDESKPQRYKSYVIRELRRLRGNEEVNQHGYEYRIVSING